MLNWTPDLPKASSTHSFLISINENTSFWSFKSPTLDSSFRKSDTSTFRTHPKSHVSHHLHSLTLIRDAVSSSLNSCNSVVTVYLLLSLLPYILFPRQHGKPFNMEVISCYFSVQNPAIVHIFIYSGKVLKIVLKVLYNLASTYPFYPHMLPLLHCSHKSLLEWTFSYSRYTKILLYTGQFPIGSATHLLPALGFSFLK